MVEQKLEDAKEDEDQSGGARTDAKNTKPLKKILIEAAEKQKKTMISLANSTSLNTNHWI